MADLDGGDIFFNIRGDASDLENAINRSQDALGDLEGGADTASDSLGSMGKTAGQVSSALKGASRGGVAGLSSAVSAINPAAGRAIRGLSGLKKAFAAGAATVGPLLIALAAVAAAVKLFQDHQEDLDRRLEISKDVADEMAAAELRLRDAYEQNLVAVGDLSDAELKVLTIRRQAFAENQPQVKALNASIAEQIMRVEKAKGAFEDLNEGQRNFEQLQGLLTDGLQKEQAELERLQSQRDAAIETMRDTVKLKIENIELTEEQTAASTAQADAFKAEEQRLLDVARAARVAQDALNALGRSQQQEAQNRSIERIEQETEIEHFNRTNADREKKHADDTARLAAETRDKRVSFAKDANQQIGQTTAAFASVMADKHKKASLIAYRVSQASGIAEATISTAKGVAKAMELGPIFGPPAAVLMGALGAMQVATIAAVPPPTAHIGTGMPGSRDPLAPDERMSSGRRVLTTEASGPGGVVNSMGTQLLNDVNTGRVQSTGRITAVIGRSHLDQELFRSGRRGTSRYARSLRTNPHPKPQGGY